uniref:Uncharacterized protein n=1 Tax=Rattus norvegicus TaxID=10116 RepID=A0A8I6AII7_RAT
CLMEDFFKKKKRFKEGGRESLVGKNVVVELKKDLSICGTNPPLCGPTSVSLTDPEKYPHVLSSQEPLHPGLSYVRLPADGGDTQLPRDAARKGGSPSAGQ